MLIFLDNRAPSMAAEKISKYGNLIEFSTEKITYPAISCHPDIFFYRGNNFIISASNLPEKYTEILKNKGVNFRTGSLPVGIKYPESARYCAVSSGNLLICNQDIVEQSIMNPDMELVSTRQGYVRCNLVPLKGSSFITSDMGIYKKLLKKGYRVLPVSGNNILLPGFKHGFIGGTCGVMEDFIFFIGSLQYHPQGDEIRSFLSGLDYEIIELYDGPLYDGGGILII